MQYFILIFLVCACISLGLNYYYVQNYDNYELAAATNVNLLVRAKEGLLNVSSLEIDNQGDQEVLIFSTKSTTTPIDFDFVNPEITSSDLLDLTWPRNFKQNQNAPQSLKFECQFTCNTSKSDLPENQYATLAKKMFILPKKRHAALPRLLGLDYKQILSSEKWPDKIMAEKAKLKLFHFLSGRDTNFPNLDVIEKKLFEYVDSYVDQFWDLQDASAVTRLTQAADLAFFNETQTVPEIYHFTWFSCHEFKIVNFISILSVLKFSSQESTIFFHTNCLPENKIFKELTQLAGNRLQILPIRPVFQLMQNLVNFPQIFLDNFNLEADMKSEINLGIFQKIEHISDVFRIFVLLKFGGIYCDDDQTC